MRVAIEVFFTSVCAVLEGFVEVAIPGHWTIGASPKIPKVSVFMVKNHRGPIIAINRPPADDRD